MVTMFIFHNNIYFLLIVLPVVYFEARQYQGNYFL